MKKVNLNNFFKIFEKYQQQLQIFENNEIKKAFIAIQILELWNTIEICIKFHVVVIAFQGTSEEVP